MLRTPVTGQFIGNLIFGFLATAIAHLGQGSWITLAVDNGANNRHAGNTGDVRDGMMHTDVHLIQALLHAPNPVRALIDHGVAFTE